jgi:glutamine---fructose-6-phosphate transaminase (isomerizing)
MCGIFGVVGSNNAYEEIKDGLDRISYRGYDSSGIATLKDSLHIEKVAGHPEGLPDVPYRHNVGIGHDRWATHSPPTKENAHPYISNDGCIALVHNGIVENYPEVKDILLGFQFSTTTDTEVLPNLIQHYLRRDNNIENAIINLSKVIRGAYAIAFLHRDYPDQIFLIKYGSPLCIGRAGSKHYISSDISSFPSEVKEVIVMKDYRFAVIKKDSIRMRTLGGLESDSAWEKINEETETYLLGEHSSYLEKEIKEQPFYLENAINGRIIQDPPEIRLAGISKYADELTNADEVVFVGCGSAFVAARIAAHAMENIGGIRARAFSAGELQYSNPIITPKTVLVAISQSGETADTIGCIKLYRDRGAITIGIVNVVNSTISRLVDAGIYIRAGQEVSVASTKALTNQIFNLLMLAYMVGNKRSLPRSEYISFIFESKKIPNMISEINQLTETYESIATRYAESKSMVCIGRGLLEHIASEAALKIKELSYIHAEGYSGSELKHGPLALISRDVPTLAFVQAGLLGRKITSNLHEIKSREGSIIAITSESQDPIPCHYRISIPKVGNSYLNAICHLVVAQNVAYFLAKRLKRPIDRPRNLAKSVTVE